MFFKHEMRYRHLAGYPPYRYLVSLVFSHKTKEMVEKDVKAAMQILEKKENGKILGPASLNKLRDEYRMRILLKGKDQALLNHYAWDVYQNHITKKARTRLDIDVSPVVLE